MIDHESARPIYRQLADLLRAQIRSGKIKPDRPVPSIKSLMQEHGIAHGTAIHALRVLIEEGYLEAVQGRGHFVTDPSNWPAK